MCIASEEVKAKYIQPKICETTPDVKHYSGYIHLPAGSLVDTGLDNRYEINLFFWYFRAKRNADRAPLALWLTGKQSIGINHNAKRIGGPGASSLKGVFQENGPCFINQDSRTTRLNSWSWNREANMLFVLHKLDAYN
jgi:carboxypeptidase C (cathepsin A)